VKKVTCGNGHFYDADRFTSCPICGQAGEEIMTKPEFGNVKSEATLPLSQPSAVDELSSTTWLSPEELRRLWEDEPPVESSAQEQQLFQDHQKQAAPSQQVDELAPTMWTVPDLSSLVECEEFPTPPALEGDEAMLSEKVGEPPEALGTDKLPEMGRACGEPSFAVDVQSAVPDAPDSNAQPQSSLAQAVAASDALGISPVPEAVQQKTDVFVTRPPILPVGWLVGLSDASRGKIFPCKSGRNRIGREMQMDISLPGEDSVDPSGHAQIIYEPKKRQFFLQTGNGDGLTYLNNQLVFTHEEIHPYDRITLGEAEFIFIPLCGESFEWDMNVYGSEVP